MRRAEAGFTLVESLIASTILVFGVLGVLAVFPQAFEGARSSGHQSTLSRLAQEKMEQLISLGFAATDLNIGTHPTQSSDSEGAKYYAITGYPEEYSLRWIVSAGPTDGSGGAVAGLKTVAIEATRNVRYASDGTALDSVSGQTVTMQTLVVE